MAGLFLLMTLALFAENPYCYFAALFIVATAVTQLDFLQNLAAIIRGSKEYFEYQKEFLSRGEVEETVEKEVEEIEAAPVDIAEVQSERAVKASVESTNMSDSEFALLVQDYTFNFLEKKYGKPIQRNVRYMRKGSVVEFDGVMQTEGIDLIFEIKTSKRVFPASVLVHSAKQLVVAVRKYQEITNRSASLRMILVGNYPPSYIQTVSRNRGKLLDWVRDIEITFEAYTFEQIGLPGVQTDE